MSSVRANGVGHAGGCPVYGGDLGLKYPSGKTRSLARTIASLTHKFDANADPAISRQMSMPLSRSVGSPLSGLVPASELVNQLAIGRTGIVRPSRRPLCGLLRIFSMPTKSYVILRSPRSGRLEGRFTVLSPHYPIPISSHAPPPGQALEQVADVAQRLMPALSRPGEMERSRGGGRDLRPSSGAR